MLSFADTYAFIFIRSHNAGNICYGLLLHIRYLEVRKVKSFQLVEFK